MSITEERPLCPVFPHYQPVLPLFRHTAPLVGFPLPTRRLLTVEKNG